MTKATPDIFNFQLRSLKK